MAQTIFNFADDFIPTLQKAFLDPSFKSLLQNVEVQNIQQHIFNICSSLVIQIQSYIVPSLTQNCSDLVLQAEGGPAHFLEVLGQKLECNVYWDILGLPQFTHEMEKNCSTLHLELLCGKLSKVRLEQHLPYRNKFIANLFSSKIVGEDEEVVKDNHKEIKVGNEPNQTEDVLNQTEVMAATTEKAAEKTSTCNYPNPGIYNSHFPNK